MGTFERLRIVFISILSVLNKLIPIGIILYLTRSTIGRFQIIAFQINFSQCSGITKITFRTRLNSSLSVELLILNCKSIDFADVSLYGRDC